MWYAHLVPQCAIWSMALRRAAEVPIIRDREIDGVRLALFTVRIAQELARGRLLEYWARDHVGGRTP